MIVDGSFDIRLWLGRQSALVIDLFERAATELEASGIRLLAGSIPPKFEECDCSKKIGISPLRFSTGEEFLSLSLEASTRGGAPRYVVRLEIRGALVSQSLFNLVNGYPDVWTRAYLMSGLWIGDGTNWNLLNHFDQLSVLPSYTTVSIGGAFLHSDMPRTIQEGVMVVGVLYRSVLDELSNAGKMSRLYTQLSNILGERMPIFRRLLSP